MSKIRKHSLIVAGRKTSISIEDEFWNALQEIADSNDVSASQLVSQIAQLYGPGNLSSNVRIFLLERFRKSPLKH
jgi:predicted DNA-binding ribbon-helix-helix protein